MRFLVHSAALNNKGDGNMVKSLPLLLLLVLVPGLVLAGEEKVILVDNFDGSGPRLGDAWNPFCDENNLGTKVNPFEVVSEGSPRGFKGHGRFTGHMGKHKDPWPWATLDLRFPDSPQDLTRYSSVRFWAKGDGKKYRVRMSRAVIEDYCDFEYVFTAPREWTLITAPLKDFKQPNWGKQVARDFKDVNMIGFLALAPGDDEDFDLRFTNVEFVSGAPAKKDR